MEEHKHWKVKKNTTATKETEQKVNNRLQTICYAVHKATLYCSQNCVYSVYIVKNLYNTHLFKPDN